ncbi:MAG: hypothetical protein DCC75_03100 [Proteobacteria bacterium]|nr:MAG: hypothetical protein DCC75_03100 [Pseudomonadota bacterium]
MLYRKVAVARVYSIALNTFRELYRGKVLYAVVFFAVLLVVAASAFGAVTVGDQLLVIKDIGLFSISFFSMGFAVIAGATLLHKELSRKTIYNILAKPVERYEFLLGKYLGMLAVSLFMVVLMALALTGYIFLFSRVWEWGIMAALIYTFMELSIICACAIFFSTIVVTPVLGGLFTLGIFLAGRSLEYLMYFIQEGELAGLSAGLMRALYFTLPNFSSLNISGEIVFGDFSALGADRVLWSLLYSISYAAVLLLLANFAFRRREFN